MGQVAAIIVAPNIGAFAVIAESSRDPVELHEGDRNETIPFIGAAMGCALLALIAFAGLP